MNPSDYYKHEVVNKVREPELRKVASVLADHIGQQNAITLAELCARTNMGERQARRAIELLVNDYSIPVGAHSGKDGRWIIDSKAEMDAVIAELTSRANKMNKRANALRRAVLPKTAEPQQTALFEQPKPEPWQLQYGGWR